MKRSQSLMMSSLGLSCGVFVVWPMHDVETIERLNKQWTNPFQYVMIMRRMKQILSDPAEFGKAVLESKKRDHCIQNADDVGDC